MKKESILIKLFSNKLIGQTVKIADYETEVITIAPLTLNGKTIIIVDTKAGFVCNINLLKQFNPGLFSSVDLQRAINLYEDSK